MRASTSIYFAAYHSTSGLYLRGSTGRFLAVEQAIAAGEWPYDHGDDPSFYAARRGGLLAWGVCRQDVRNAIAVGSIVVFFSFAKQASNVHYRLSAVATVADKLERRRLFTDRRFRPQEYLNILIRPENGGWRYDESDRPPRKSARHGDWLWRMAVHGWRKKVFEKKYEHIYRRQWFSDGEVPVAENYVVFSQAADETYISPCPPLVATAIIGDHEKWVDRQLKKLTVDKAAALTPTGRNYLRTTNRSGQNVHPEIRFEMPATEAVAWRRELMSALKNRELEARGVSVRFRTRNKHEKRT